jgi:NitT/TauT family transport system permease protein
LQYVPAERGRALAKTIPACNISLLDHGIRHRLGRGWNASIVAEYFHFRGQTISTTGLGAIISYATDSGNFRLLLAATVVMAVRVVTINRLVWRPLYALASTRFKLEG